MREGEFWTDKDGRVNRKQKERLEREGGLFYGLFK